MTITINGNGTITGLSAGGLPNGSVTTATLATTAKPLFSGYALLTDQKDGATDGGTPSANNWNKRTLNTIVVDTNSIINSLSSDEFTLNAGTYFIKYTVPNYRAERCVAQLYDVNATAAVQSNVVNMTGYAAKTNASTGYSYQHLPNWARVTISSGTNTYYIRNYVDSANSGNGLGMDLPDDCADSAYYATVEIFKEA